MAPLPLGEIGSVTKCQYCGTEARILDPQPPRARVPEAALGPRIVVSAGRSMRSVDQIKSEIQERVQEARERSIRVGIIFAVVLVLAAGFGLVLALSGSSETTSSAGVPSGPTPAAAAVPIAPGVTAAPEDRGLARSDLATFDREEWTKLDATGMPGDLHRFDPLPATPWALDMARAWSPDARLRILYVEGLLPNGTLDLTTATEPGAPEKQVDWRFYSPARRAAAAKMAEVSDQTIRTGFRITVEAGGAKIYAFSTSDDASPAAFTPACPLPRMLESFHANGLPQRPHYSLMLHEVPLGRQSAWVWEENMYLELPKGVRGDESCAPVRLPP
jgi:hypothetical protein